MSKEATSDLMTLEFLWYEIFIASLWKLSKKKWIFYGQADRKGGPGQPPRP